MLVALSDLPFKGGSRGKIQVRIVLLTAEASAESRSRDRGLGFRA